MKVTYVDQRFGHRISDPVTVKADAFMAKDKDTASTHARRHWLFGLALILCHLFSSGIQAKAAPVIVALGDSLSAGYELAESDAFPSQLKLALSKLGLNAEVRNAAVSGDTSMGGLSRLDWAMDGKVDLVILELGANDALRGLDPKGTESNLDMIITKIKARGALVLLAGMYAPPNMGRDYADAFNPIYPRLAARHKIPLYPFFLDGVAAQPGLRLPDGMHPNPAGVKIIAEKIAPSVVKALGK
jgi:acyl-CoA thioesterase-1